MLALSLGAPRAKGPPLAQVQVGHAPVVDSALAFVVQFVLVIHANAFVSVVSATLACVARNAESFLVRVLMIPLGCFWSS